MDVYRQAADIIRVVREGRGTAKALCLRKEMQKKKQTYAVVCETLRHWELLHDVLEVAEFFTYYPRASRELALCMTYDVVMGKGVHTRSDSTARAIAQSAAYLREAYWQVHKHHAPAADADNNDNNNNNTTTRRTDGGDGGVVALPRYARVNTLKVSVDELVTRLRRAQAQPPRDERDATQQQRRRRRPLPPFTLDAVVPSLLVFAAGTDLHAHPAVRSGQLVLQDRASCLPACVLLDAVPVERTCADNDDDNSDKKHNNNKHNNTKKDARTQSAASTSSAPVRPLEYVIDACAAPGNKTTQLAALGAAQHIKIMATERDERRAALLQQRVHSLGADDYVNVVHADFFDLSSDDRAAAEAILLDPSCSASGVVTRVDVRLAQQQRSRSDNNGATATMTRRVGDKRTRHDDSDNNDNNNDDDAMTTTTSCNVEDEANAFACDAERVDKLARLQRKLLTHALLSFDHCRTVVYSTCSVHEAENEAVVLQVMRDARVRARGWTLSNIMPGGMWPTRGHRLLHTPTQAGGNNDDNNNNNDDNDDTDVPLHYTIRCDPATDATNGFYVARFDRVVPSPSS